MPIGVRFGGSEGTRSPRARGGGVPQPPKPDQNTVLARKQLMEYQAGLEQEGFEFRLTTKQKAEEDKLRDALDDLSRSDDFTEEEKGTFKRDLQAKMAGIKPLPHRKEKFDFEKNIFTDPETKKRFFIQPGGKGRPFEIESEQRKKLTPELRSKIWEKAADSAFNKDTGKTDWDMVEERYARAISMLGGEVSKLGGGGFGGIGGQQGAEIVGEPQPTDIALSAALGEESQPVGGVQPLPQPQPFIPEEDPLFTMKSLTGFPQAEARGDAPIGGTPEWVFRNEETGQEIFPEGKAPEKVPFREDKAKKIPQKATGDSLLDEAYAIGEELKAQLQGLDKTEVLRFGKSGEVKSRLKGRQKDFTPELKKIAFYIFSYEDAIQKNDFTAITKYTKLLDTLVKSHKPKTGTAIAKAKK